MYILVRMYDLLDLGHMQDENSLLCVLYVT